MKKYIFKIIVVLSLFIICSPVQASSYKGYNRKPSVNTLIFKEPIDRIIETDTEFLILLMNHPAFYRFPKNPDTSIQIKNFLQDRNKKKKVLEWQIDPVTTEIYYVQDVK